MVRLTTFDDIVTDFKATVGQDSLPARACFLLTFHVVHLQSGRQGATTAAIVCLEEISNRIDTAALEAFFFEIRIGLWVHREKEVSWVLNLASNALDGARSDMGGGWAGGSSGSFLAAGREGGRSWSGMVRFLGDAGCVVWDFDLEGSGVCGGLFARRSTGGDAGRGTGGGGRGSGSHWIEKLRGFAIFGCCGDVLEIEVVRKCDVRNATKML